MKRILLQEQLIEILNFICGEVGERPTGSYNNQQMVDYTKNYFQDNGYDVELQEFPCLNWINNGAELLSGKDRITAYPSYYAYPCNLKAEYTTLATIKELEKSKLTGKIAVLHDELVEEKIMPKNFPFYNPDRHQKIVNLLEEKRPLAIVTIVKKKRSIFEDGDFKIPSVYVPEEEGRQLLDKRGELKLRIQTTLETTTAANVIARINSEADKKVVITAHLDTKYGTPGALDNGTGIAVLLSLSSLIQAEDIDYCLELLLLNGEDYYSIPGQMKYSEEYIKEEDIYLAINCDGLGLKNSKTAAALFKLETEEEQVIKKSIEERNKFTIIDNWVEGDHMLFVMNEIPAVAFTSQGIFELIDKVVHTEEDNLELINYEKLIDMTICLENIIKNIK